MEVTMATVDLNNAVNVAEQRLTSILGGNCQEIRLEELELSDDDRYWLVTLSYEDSRDTIPRRRRYKTIKLDAKTGEFRAMTIRGVTDGE